MIKKTFYIIFALFIFSIVYLNYFGVSTNKFNQNIEKKFRENYPGVNLKLNNVKVLLNISKLSIDLKTENPIIFSSKEEIKLKNVSTTYDLKSFFKKEFTIKNLIIDSKKNQIKKIIKLARSFKDSPQLLIIDKIIKSGNVEISTRLNFDENGKLLEDEYEILANINSLSIELFNKQKIDNISGNLKYTQSKIEINNLKYNYVDLELYSKNVFISQKNNQYFVQGDLDTNEGAIPEFAAKFFLKNEIFKNIILSSQNNFSFNISKKFKISELKLASKINLKKAEY